MKENKRKFKILFILVCVFFLLTGCSSKDNSSPENVALAMVKRLSNDNYTNIGDIFYQPNGTFFSEEVFKELIESNKLNISGNKKSNISDIGSEITDEDGNVHVDVKVEIDNKNIFNIETIQIDNKWYVYEPDFYDGSVSFIIPDGYTLKIDNNVIGSEYKGKTKINYSLLHSEKTNRVIKIKDVDVDALVIKNLLKGSYDLTLEGDKTIKDVIYTYSNKSNIDSKNYTTSYIDDNLTYFVNVESTDLFNSTEEQKKNVSDFINTLYADIFNSILSKKDFGTLDKYFDKSSNAYKNVNESYLIVPYNCTKDNPCTSSYSKSKYYYSDVKLESVNVLEVKYIDDNNILVSSVEEVGSNYNYYSNYLKKYTTSDATTKFYTLLNLKKFGDSFVIIDEYNMFW